MKQIVFRRNKGIGYQPEEEIIEVYDNATEEKITELFFEWAWEKVMDEFTWYEKE